jgi:hypothetical protein
MGRGAFNRAHVLDRVDRRLPKLPADARVTVARDQIARLRGLNRQIDRLKAELGELVAAHRSKPLAEQGCGALTAAILIRPHRRHQALPLEGKLRATDRDRPDPLLLRPAQRAPAQPRRGPPAQPRAAHHCRHPRPARAGDQGVPVAQEAEGKTSKGAQRMRETTARGDRGRPEVIMFEPVTTSDWFTGTWVRPVADVRSALVPT